MIHVHSVEVDPTLKPTEEGQAVMNVGLLAKLPLDLARWLVWDEDGFDAWIRLRTALQDEMRRRLEALNKVRIERSR